MFVGQEAVIYLPDQVTAAVAGNSVEVIAVSLKAEAPVTLSGRGGATAVRGMKLTQDFEEPTGGAAFLTRASLYSPDNQPPGPRGNKLSALLRGPSHKPRLRDIPRK